MPVTPEPPSARPAFQVLSDYREEHGLPRVSSVKAILPLLRGQGVARELAEAAWLEVPREVRRALWQAEALTLLGLPCESTEDGQLQPVLTARLFLRDPEDPQGHWRPYLVLTPAGALELRYPADFPGGWVIGYWGLFPVGGGWIQRGRRPDVGRITPLRGGENGVAQGPEDIAGIITRSVFANMSRWGVPALRLLDALGLYQELDPESALDSVHEFSVMLWHRVTGMAAIDGEAVLSSICDYKGIYADDQFIRAIARSIETEGAPVGLRLLDLGKPETLAILFGKVTAARLTTIGLTESEEQQLMHTVQQLDTTGHYARGVSLLWSDNSGDWGWVAVEPAPLPVAPEVLESVGGAL